MTRVFVNEINVNPNNFPFSHLQKVEIGEDSGESHQVQRYLQPAQLEEVHWDT